MFAVSFTIMAAKAKDEIVYGESRGQTERRLSAAGKLDEFYKHIENAKKGGMDGSAAWRGALTAFSHVKAPKPDTIPLTDPTPFIGKELDEASTVRWVAASMALGVKPEAAPSAAAWGLLLWAREHSDSFWQTVYTKILPSKSQLDQGAGKMRDDGSEILATLDRIRPKAAVG